MSYLFEMAQPVAVEFEGQPRTGWIAQRDFDEDGNRYMVHIEIGEGVDLITHEPWFAEANVSAV
jgi:hypothetical protein